MRKEYVGDHHVSCTRGADDGAGGRRVGHVHRGIRHRYHRGGCLRCDPLHGRHRGFHCVGAQPHHRSRAQHQGLASCAGASTVEAALAIATLVLVLVLCLAGVTAVSMQVRCIDAAREAARLAARGDVRSATDVARSIAPRAALVQVHRDGEFVVATVTAHSNLLPTLDIAARAISVDEPGLTAVRHRVCVAMSRWL
ncbi:conserved hypothetical protein, partial [Mycobacterium tuberculosis variant africanum K85]